jgi:hypothetical protein
MVLVDTLALNVRNPFWGPDSESFRPDRFKDIKQSDVRILSPPHSPSIVHKNIPIPVFPS